MIQRMYPIAHFCSWTRGTGSGHHTAAGTSYDTMSGECADHCDDFYGAEDATDYGCARSSATAGQTSLGRSEFTFTDPPLNVTIASLTVVIRVRTSNAGSASIDSSPTLMCFVDPASGTRDYEAGTHTVTAARNRNTEAPGGFQEFRATWAAKPGGGAWTRTELLSGSFKAGFASDGAGHGSGIDATTGGSSASLDWDQVFIELDTTPTGVFCEPVRAQLSHTLRLSRRCRRTVSVDVPLSFAAAHAGQTIYSAHDLLPWDAGMLAWEQVPLFLIGTTPHMQDCTITLTLMDLREAYADFWSPLCVTGIDAQRTGLAWVDRGGDWSTARAQVTYVQRADGLFKAVAANTPALTEIGLLIQGGDDFGSPDKNWLLNSTFSQGAGSTFTSWTKAGTGTIAEDTGDYLIDEAGFQRSCRLTTGGGQSATVAQGVAINTWGRVRIWYKSASVAPSFYVQRSSDGLYWDEDGGGGTGAWVESAQANALAASATRAHYVSKRFTVAGDTVTVTVGVGASADLHLYSVELMDALHSWWGGRTILPTTNATVSRIGDYTSLQNTTSYRVWNPSRGHCHFDYRPSWSHADLDDLDELHLIVSRFGAAGYYRAIEYKRNDASTGTWSSPSLTVTGANLIAAGTWYSIALRWTSEAENELGLDGQAVDLWINGVKATSATGATEITPDNLSAVHVGPTTNYWHADGLYKNLLICGRVPTDAEMARL